MERYKPPMNNPVRLTINKGLQELRLREFIKRNAERYQDLICEAQVTGNQKELKFYQKEFEFYKSAYTKQLKKSFNEFDKDVTSIAKNHNLKKEPLRQRFMVEIEKSWKEYKQKRSQTFDDIYYFQQVKELSH